ncbi:MAG TPA: hypothetical protein VNV66_03820, partial [Pilimelia sp.]|nr:hypothetical protein [Pilimelia sp.]
MPPPAAPAVVLPDLSAVLPGAVGRPPSRPGAGRGSLVVLLAVALLALCGGGAAGGYLLLGDRVTDALSATSTTIVAPDTLAGRPRRTTGDADAAAEAALAVLRRSLPRATSSAAAVYGDPARRNMIMFMAAAGSGAAPPV